MNAVTRYNLVAFVPDPPAADPSDPLSGPSDAAPGPIYLELSQPWVMSAGLQHDVNVAKVSYAEFDKLGGDVNRVGKIQFFYRSQTRPDVTLQNIRLIDVRPGPVEEILGSSGPTLSIDAGELQTPKPSSGVHVRPAEYTLAFADFRINFVVPRGPRLKLGLINAGDQPPENPDDADTPELSTSDLIRKCVVAMGAANTVPGGSDKAIAPRNVKWFGSHAPTELAKLLPAAGCVFCPDAQGKGYVALLSSKASAPPFPDGDALPEASAAKSDHRAKTVIVGSYPNRTVITTTVEGPSDDRFYFVAQDSKGVWKPLAQVDYLNGDPAGQAKKNFTGVDPKWRSTAAAQTYRCLQLASNDDYAPPQVSPILTRMFDTDGSDGATLAGETDIEVYATVAIRDPNTGQWSNSGGQVRIPVTHVLQGNVLILSRAIFKVAAPCDDFTTQFQALADGDFNVRFSVEDAEQDEETGDWKPAYFEAGYQRDTDGSTTKLSDDEVATALDGTGSGDLKDVLVVERPELILFNIDDDDLNRKKLEDAAQPIAEALLASAADPQKIYSCRGFAAVFPSGSISRVEWNQTELKTTAIGNDWFAPAGVLSPADLQKAQALPAHPQQPQQQARASKLGVSGSTIPAAAVSPIVPPADPPPFVMINIQSPGSVGGEYQATISSPSLDTSIGTLFSVSDGGTTKVLAINLMEQSRTTHVVPNGKILQGFPGPPQSNGTPTYYIQYDPDAIRSIRWNATNFAIEYSPLQEPTPADWKNLVTFVDPCAT